jgi:hypothetical protein
MTVAGLIHNRHKSKPPALEALAACNCETAAQTATEGGTYSPLLSQAGEPNKGDVSVTHAYALAAELAQPVVRGHLPLAHAYAAMLASTVAAERLGELAPYKAPDVYRLQRHLLGQRLQRLETRRAITEMRIKRRIRPMIALGKPRNAVLAEAHDVNGAEGFPFDEPDVNDIALGEVWLAGRRRHVR